MLVCFSWFKFFHLKMPMRTIPNSIFPHTGWRLFFLPLPSDRRQQTIHYLIFFFFISSDTFIQESNFSFVSLMFGRCDREVLIKLNDHQTISINPIALIEFVHYWNIEKVKMTVKQNRVPYRTRRIARTSLRSLI